MKPLGYLSLATGVLATRSALQYSDIGVAMAAGLLFGLGICFAWIVPMALRHT